MWRKDQATRLGLKKNSEIKQKTIGKNQEIKSQVGNNETKGKLLKGYR